MLYVIQVTSRQTRASDGQRPFKTSHAPQRFRKGFCRACVLFVSQMLKGEQLLLEPIVPEACFTSLGSLSAAVYGKYMGSSISTDSIRCLMVATIWVALHTRVLGAMLVSRIVPSVTYPTLLLINLSYLINFPSHLALLSC